MGDRQITNKRGNENKHITPDSVNNDDEVCMVK